MQEQDKIRLGLNANSPDQNAKEVLDKIASMPGGKEAINRVANKDDELTEFQKTNGISERIAEAAIKEWVLTHNGDFDWNLEDVKAICLRNKRDGIPRQYLPESEK